MKNKLIAIFMALTFCFLSSFCFCSVGSSNIVYALDTGFPTEAKFVTNLTEYEALALVDQFYNNATVQAKGFDKYNSILCISYNGGNYTYDVACLKMSAVTYHQSRYYVRPNFITAYSALCSRSDNSNYIYARQISSIANNDYSVNSDILQNYSLIGINFCPDYNNFYYVYVVDPTNDYLIYNRPQEFTAFVYNNSYIPPFDPILDPLLDYPYNLDVQRQAFLEWLLVDNKYELINGAILQNHVGGWVDIFADYGGSQSFFRRVALQFINANSINMVVNDINDALTVTKRLYQLYLSDKADTVRNHLIRRTEDTDNVIPITNDNDTALITDLSTDTVDISILRDILRACINIPNVISDNFAILFDTLSDLDNTVIITNQGGISDLSILYEYDINDFNDDFETFEENVSDITAVPLSYVQTINNNSLMPENMLSDKQSLTVNIPVINGFTVNSDGTQYETNTDIYTLNSIDYPWLDTIVKKMKRFASIMLIIGYLIHLRFKIADIVRGE